jgi:NADPH:quinone reductase-like Zn-dependent oxidoreductase
VIPSHEVSGVVAATADDVTDVAVGDEISGLIRFDRDGAAAEYVTVPAADLAPRPKKVSHIVSAALPLAGLTAWQALVDHAAVQPGERVLVYGGAGGVGALTVQLAAILGADVTTTVRSDAHDVVTALGASRVIDIRTERFDGGDARYDVVIDTVGGETLDRSFGIVRLGGRLVTLSAPPPAGKA